MKIMFFAHDPGGVNAISPLIEPMKLQGHEVFVYFKNLEKPLAEIKPDLLITGTSANDMTEKHLWKEAKELNIKSIAILDHWVNYGIRFSKYGLKDVDKFDKICEFLPDYIVVMDEFAKGEMANDGVPCDRIYPLGNPHFEDILNQTKDLKNIKSQFADKNETLITFASEPYTEDYGKGPEKKVLEDLIKITEGQNVKILVKLHPKEDLSKYQEFNNVIIHQGAPLLDIIISSDIVVSMTSMFLIEAMILNKKIISYQPAADTPDKFILTRNGVLPFINNYKNFEKELFSIINSNNYLQYNSFTKMNAVENIIKFINKEVLKCKTN